MCQVPKQNSKIKTKWHGAVLMVPSTTSDIENAKGTILMRNELNRAAVLGGHQAFVFCPRKCKQLD